MRSFLRFLWMVLVLLIVAITSALITMRLAVHGREVSVPELVGKTPFEARRLSEARGLSAQVVRQYYSATIPEGRVISQTPAAASVVRRGWEIRLATSLGPQRASIPKVIGDSQRAAMIILQQRGLQAASIASISLPNSAPDQVVGQDPPENASDVEAPKVSLLLSQADSKQVFVMPRFIGQPLGSAILTLKNAGFTLGKVTMQSDTGAPVQQPGMPTNSPLPLQNPSPAAIVVSQDPASGQKILAGSEIRFVVR